MLGNINFKLPKSLKIPDIKMPKMNVPDFSSMKPSDFGLPEFDVSSLKMPDMKSLGIPDLKSFKFDPSKINLSKFGISDMSFDNLPDVSKWTKGFDLESMISGSLDIKSLIGDMSLDSITSKFNIPDIGLDGMSFPSLDSFMPDIKMPDLSFDL